MTEPPIPPLDPGVLALFARDASAYPEEPAAKARVLRGVRRSAILALPTMPSPAHAPSAGPPPLDPVGGSAAAVGALTGTKVAALVALAFILGGAAGAALVSRTRTARIVAPAAQVVTTSPAVVASVPWVVVPSSEPAPGQTGAPTSTPPVTPGLASRPPDVDATHGADRGTGALARQREALDAARAAFAHGQFVDALTALRDHEIRWPHGLLEEEREALTIQALAASGQGKAAAERAIRFRRSFPDSMMMDVVNLALARADASKSNR